MTKVWVVQDRYYTDRVQAIAACNALNEEGYPVRIEEREIDVQEERQEQRFLAMDIKLFLRLASVHFPHSADRTVLSRLNELADVYGAGLDISKLKADRR